MKSFVKNTPVEHSSLYEPSVTVRYMSGAKPEFVIFSDEGAELERVDMTHLKLQELHELMASRGFVARSRVVEEPAAAGEEASMPGSAEL